MPLTDARCRVLDLMRRIEKAKQLRDSAVASGCINQANLLADEIQCLREQLETARYEAEKDLADAD